MATKNKDIALLVHACDRYEFLFKGFELFFTKHWDFSIPCHCYFATEKKHVAVREFQNIHSGPGEWADRLIVLLEKRIAEKYVIYFQEDMWLSKKVNPAFFAELFALMDQNNWQQIKLHSSEVYQTIPTNLFIQGFNVAKVDRQNSGFLMSHQVTLWNKEFLLKQLFKGEHPWRNERKGTARLKKSNSEIFHIDYFAENGKEAINKNHQPTGRSEYRTISENGLLNSNIITFISELAKGTIEQQQYAAELEHHYLNKMTHDGKPRPRKTDVFKGLKNYIKGKIN